MSGLGRRLYRFGKRRFEALYAGAVTTGPVLDMERFFPAHAELERLFPRLRQEALALLPLSEALPRFHELSSTQGRFAYRDGRRWSVLPLRLYGLDLPENQRLLPALRPFLAAHPQVVSALVSCLESGKHIRPHRGPFRGVLRYHLCLHCLQEAGRPCLLRVHDREHRFVEGRALLWDDTFEHEVRNLTASDRIVLLLDVRRSGLPPLADAVTRTVIALVGLHCRLRRHRFRLPPQLAALTAAAGTAGAAAASLPASGG